MSMVKRWLVSLSIKLSIFFQQELTIVLVDGGAWHVHGAEAGSDFKYPDFLLSDGVVSGVKGTRKAKI